VIDLVVFDMAGTTVHDDDGVNRCLRAALRRHGIEVDRAAVNRVMGLPKPAAIRVLIGGNPAARRDPEALIAAVHDDFAQTMVDAYRDDPDVRPMAGAEAAFRALQALDVRVALDTGFNRVIADAVLRRLGWSDRHGLIDAVVTSDEVPQGRPAPDLIFAAMSRLGLVDASCVAKVGDTPADLEEGASAGCGLVVGVTFGSHTRDELSVAPHTHLVDRLADVVDLVRARCAITPGARRHA
jgi:phosphonatase-like hydrolase